MATYEVAADVRATGSCIVYFVVDDATRLVTTVQVRNTLGQPVRLYVNSNSGWEHSRSIGAGDGTLYSQNVPGNRRFAYDTFDWDLTLNVDDD